MSPSCRQRVPRVPSFEGDERLKFTDEEQQAIRAAERAFAYGSQRRQVLAEDRTHAGNSLLLAIILALGSMLLG